MKHLDVAGGTGIVQASFFNVLDFELVIIRIPIQILIFSFLSSCFVILS